MGGSTRSFCFLEIPPRDRGEINFRDRKLGRRWFAAAVSFKKVAEKQNDDYRLVPSPATRAGERECAYRMLDTYKGEGVEPVLRIIAYYARSRYYLEW